MTDFTARVDVADAEVAVTAAGAELPQLTLTLPPYPDRWRDLVAGDWRTEGYDRADTALRAAGYERVGPWVQELADGPAMGTTMLLATGVWSAVVLGPETTTAEARRWLGEADREVREEGRTYRSGGGRWLEMGWAAERLHGARRAYARALGLPADAGDDDGTGGTTQDWQRRVERRARAART